MGKKSKQKQHRQQANQSNGSRPASQVAVASTSALGERLVQESSPTATKAAVKPNDALSDHAHIRGDMRRISVLLIVVVVVLVSAVIVQKRSDYLTRAGASITRFLEL